MPNDHFIPYHIRHNRDRLTYIAFSDPGLSQQSETSLRLEGFELLKFYSFTKLLEAAEQRVPDIVVLQDTIDGHSAVEVLKTLAARHNLPPTFVILSSNDVDLAVASMKAGAYDAIRTPLNTERLLMGVRDALWRNAYMLPPEKKGGTASIRIRGFSQLTAREREVLELLVNGKSNRDAAEGLGISSRTVEVHRAKCMKKLGARNAADLVRIVTAQGVNH